MKLAEEIKAAGLKPLFKEDLEGFPQFESDIQVLRTLGFSIDQESVEFCFKAKKHCEEEEIACSIFCLEEAGKIKSVINFEGLLISHDMPTIEHNWNTIPVKAIIECNYAQLIDPKIIDLLLV